MNCRICGSSTAPFMSFGRMPLANGFLREQEFSSEYFYELQPMFCETCHTFQIAEQPAPEAMFHGSYPFYSRTSCAMVEHFGRYAQWVGERYLDGRDPLVAEIGSNDGALLEYFAKRSVRHIGIEPSANVAEEARSHGVKTLTAFFSSDVAEALAIEEGKADVILAANVMCHIPDLGSVASAVDIFLKPEGVLVFEDPYLGDMLAKTSYDQIYDEHVYIFSCHAVNSIFGRSGLEVIDVQALPTHGGSMRYVLARCGTRPVEAAVKELMEAEKNLELHLADRYDRFREQCETSRTQLRALLGRLKEEGDRVVGYAATSKSTTVFNYCEIGPDEIEYISDTTPLKQGRFSPGMHIPVRPHEDFAADCPGYALLLAWNHRDEIMKNEQEFYSNGGRWIVFVPQVEILS